MSENKLPITLLFEISFPIEMGEFNLIISVYIYVYIILNI